MNAVQYGDKKLQTMLKFTDTCTTITMPPVIRLEEALKRKIAMAVTLNAPSQYKVAEKQNKIKVCRQM